MMKILKYMAAAAMVVFTASAAQALIVVDDGDTVDPFGTGDTVFWTIDGVSTGAGSETVTFVSATDPLGADVQASILSPTLSTFGVLTLSWISAGADGFFAGDASDTDGEFLVDSLIAQGSPALNILRTTFASPDSLTQKLVVSFTNSVKGIGFDVVVSAVPLPASLVLFLSALGGMGLLGRRRKTASVA